MSGRESASRGSIFKGGGIVQSSILVMENSSDEEGAKGSKHILAFRGA